MQNLIKNIYSDDNTIGCMIDTAAMNGLLATNNTDTKGYTKNLLFPPYGEPAGVTEL